ncbi:unnamed protein product [Debaryomyces tyrocola]|nr:unnamed protein product [Debaryomyces tyrocola]
MLYLLISNLLCFIWPLFLTLKLLNGEYRKKHTIDNKNSDQVKFLLNYWICFIVVDHIEKLVLYSGIFWPCFGFGFFPELFSCSIKLWLFYNHGCLVVNYCYLNDFLRKITCELEAVDPLEVLELNLVNPVMKTLLTENHLVPLKLLSSMKSGTISWNVGRIVKFCQCFIKSADQPFLQFSLDYFCYMDSKQDLEKHFEITKNFLASVISFLQYQLIRLNIQGEESLPQIIQLLLLPNIQETVPLHHTPKFESHNDRIEPVHMELMGTEANETFQPRLDYKSKCSSADKNYSINNKLAPRYLGRYQLTTDTKRKLPRTSSRHKYLDNAISEYVPTTISNPFQFRKFK